jgi:hypothetical protein
MRERASVHGNKSWKRTSDAQLRRYARKQLDKVEGL